MRNEGGKIEGQRKEGKRYKEGQGEVGRGREGKGKKERMGGTKGDIYIKKEGEGEMIRVKGRQRIGRGGRAIS